MTKQGIRDAYQAGNSDWEILEWLIQDGLEFPDAVYRVSSTLRLDEEGTAQMVDGYENNC